MAHPHYRWADALNDLAGLLAYRWVALPLIVLLSVKLTSLDGRVIWYLLPLLTLTFLFSIRATVALALRERAQLLAEINARKRH